MGMAMRILGFLALFGGLVQIPGLTDVVESFLEPTFENSIFRDIVPSTLDAWIGLVVGGVVAIIGIAAAHWVYVSRPGTSAALIRRLPHVHSFLVNKWYFDELYDAVVYRPVMATGKFANTVVERFVVQGIVAAAVDLVRGVGVVVRGAQSGFVRAYALLLVGGFAALGLYFLIASQ
jgi:NADH-quinone oxidoreductase subunit L